MRTAKQTGSTYRNRLGLIGLYLLATTALVAYLIFGQNEYIWMQDQDPTISLPLDADLAFKRGLFGAPALALSLVTLAHAFIITGTTGRLLATLFGIGAAWILVA